jgi:hypothetical protein
MAQSGHQTRAEPCPLSGVTPDLPAPRQRRIEFQNSERFRRGPIEFLIAVLPPLHSRVLYWPREERRAPRCCRVAPAGRTRRSLSWSACPGPASPTIFGSSTRAELATRLFVGGKAAAYAVFLPYVEALKRSTSH